MGVSPTEVTFSRRGFEASPEVRTRLEGVASVFLDGYHTALETPTIPDLCARLDDGEPASQGWAYEGAAFALSLRDRFSWRGDRLATLVESAPRHTYLIHVGAGWTLARGRRNWTAFLESLDPLLGWLALDGLGFHEGFFHPTRTLGGDRLTRLHGYALRAFDQGVGRSLWFSQGADPRRIASTVASFDETRREDLWSGIGLAATYAGGLSADGLRLLRERCGPSPALAQGAAFAAEARTRAGNITEETEAACLIFCGRGATETAELTLHCRDEVLAGPSSDDRPHYERWRERLASALTSSRSTPESRAS